MTLVDTGLNTLTGGRIKRIKDYIDTDTFMITYGDGVCNVDLKKELEFHKKHGKLMTSLYIVAYNKVDNLVCF